MWRGRLWRHHWFTSWIQLLDQCFMQWSIIGFIQIWSWGWKDTIGKSESRYFDKRHAFWWFQKSEKITLWLNWLIWDTWWDQVKTVWVNGIYILIYIDWGVEFKKWINYSSLPLHFLGMLSTIDWILCSKTKPGSSNSISLEAFDDRFKSISSMQSLFKDLLTSLRRIG